MSRSNFQHPVIEYLDGLVWDGVPRIESWLLALLVRGAR